jgi:hypothetical protein
MFTEKSQKSPYKFSCNICDYYTSKKTDYDKHVLTRKHSKTTNLFTNVDKNSPKVATKIYACDCGKEYTHRQSLYIHKKKCNFTNNEVTEYDEENKIINENDPTDKELIMLLIKENSELKNMMIEVIKNGTHNTNISYNNSNNNSHNKSFNLNFFLNETCKDAMNIMDFVDSIKLQLSDLESVGKLGFVEGISNIITNKLKSLDVTQRPVHCADNKREILYIKDEDKWEKEDEEKKKIRKAIKRVASKNLNLLPKFKEAHPDCSKASSKFSDQYNKIIVESCGGSGDNDTEKEDKIIKNIAKMVTIDKKQIS